MNPVLRLLTTASRLTAALCAAPLLCLPALAAPSTASGSLEVGATIVVACNVSGNTLNFGTAIDPLQTTGAIDASTTLAVTCTRTTPYSVALSAGANAGGLNAFGSRAMKSGTHSLAYQLYLDAARSQVWGNGTNSSVYTGTGSGNTQQLTIYGRLPSVAQAVPGDYSDTVTVTITY
ncbi:spore coat protein U-like protein [Roseateles depolymerans]|uniref:Spore coat protein U n=1 Tax=Roseateles depolymerans TaxID=76731 RepID=A0A0U3N396_9BURK|nr:spore coat U domain-containing protein [Roseateles depolymerans]ALV08644.1 Spore coat protein U [Roseateles depolymerans]REG21132.1 spore coat protein U-like protein [Roseateles depolymerans]